MAEPQSFSTRPVKIAFGANLGILLVKLGSAMVTGSAVLFSETLHSLADSVNSVFLLLGLQLALRPPDRNHPFGYGKEVYFWSFVAAMFMLGVISLGSILRGYQQVTAPESISHMDVALAGLLAALLLEIVAVSFAVQALTRCANQTTGVCTRNPIKAFTKVRDPALKLVFVEDTAAVVGVSIALGAILAVNYTDNHVVDGYAAMAIGVVLAVLAVFLALENRSKLIGMAADEGTERKIVALTRSVKGIMDVLSLKTMFMGTNRIIVHLVVEVDKDIRAERLDDVMQEVERVVKREFPEVLDCFIEPIADMDEIIGD